MAAMNIECPEVGKLLFSDSAAQLAVLAYIPNGRDDAVNARSWLEAVAQVVGGTIDEESSTSAKLLVRAQPDVYPIELKEPGITAANRFLKEKGLFPEDDDGDDVVYGDEDFPS